mmetsp:Transcript_3402/g.6543  ORF Transcript_3402/g.6543 Transcript_3402/m.6543 type:complete len:399 (+) Transcript_3402:669-1865(+)
MFFRPSNAGHAGRLRPCHGLALYRTLVTKDSNESQQIALTETIVANNDSMNPRCQNSVRRENHGSNAVPIFPFLHERVVVPFELCHQHLPPSHGQAASFEVGRNGRCRRSLGIGAIEFDLVALPQVPHGRTVVPSLHLKPKVEDIPRELLHLIEDADPRLAIVRRLQRMPVLPLGVNDIPVLRPDNLRGPRGQLVVESRDQVHGHVLHLPKHGRANHPKREEVPPAQKVHDGIHELLGQQARGKRSQKSLQLHHVTRHEQPRTLEVPTREMVLGPETKQREQLYAPSANARRPGNTIGIRPPPKELHLRKRFHPATLETSGVIPLLAIRDLYQFDGAAVFVAGYDVADGAVSDASGGEIVGDAHFADSEGVRPVAVSVAHAGSHGGRIIGIGLMESIV